MNENLDQTMAALSHPTRRAILERLMQRPERVTDLARPFKLSLNAVSRHIRVLEAARLVRRRRVWREHIVSFDPAPLDDAAKWIEHARRFWTERFDALDSLLREQQSDRTPAAPTSRSTQPRKGTR